MIIITISITSIIIIIIATITITITIITTMYYYSYLLAALAGTRKPRAAVSAIPSLTYREEQCRALKEGQTTQTAKIYLGGF